MSRSPSHLQGERFQGASGRNQALVSDRRMWLLPAPPEQEHAACNSTVSAYPLLANFLATSIQQYAACALPT